MFNQRRPRHMNAPMHHPRQQPPFFPPHQPMRNDPQARHGFHHPYQEQKKPSMIKSAFIDENGSFNMGRTLETVDQVVKTVHQVTPLVKQVSSFFVKR